MAFFHVLLNGAGTSGDGSTWADDSSGTAAYIGGDGLVSAITATATGDTIYIKGTQAASGSKAWIAGVLLADQTNPIRIIGVIAATTNLGSSIVQSDLVPGLRTGNSTRAYAQTSGNAPPKLEVTGSSSDITMRGASYIYGVIFKGSDDMLLGDSVNGQTAQLFEECSFEVTGSGDKMQFGSLSNSNPVSQTRAVHCLFELNGGDMIFRGPAHLEFYDCDFNATLASEGWLKGTEWTGSARFDTCDLSGTTTPMFDIAAYLNSNIELWNCTMPASHILTTGTYSQFHRIPNFNSDDNTGFDSADSEQQLEIETRQGLIDVEVTKVRTGGADDEATDSGGLFSWGVTISNVTDNIVGVVTPWMSKWVTGDGTAKTLTVFIANDGAGDLQEDEVYLEIMFPHETGISRYQYLPDDGAPGDGGGREQLLGTASDLTDDTGSTWGGSVGNHQTLSQAIAPDYRGLVRCRVHYSKSGGAVMYVDPQPTIA